MPVTIFFFHFASLNAMHLLFHCTRINYFTILPSPALSNSSRISLSTVCISLRLSCSMWNTLNWLSRVWSHLIRCRKVTSLFLFLSFFLSFSCLFSRALWIVRLRYLSLLLAVCLLLSSSLLSSHRYTWLLYNHSDLWGSVAWDTCLSLPLSSFANFVQATIYDCDFMFLHNVLLSERGKKPLLPSPSPHWIYFLCFRSRLMNLSLQGFTGFSALLSLSHSLSLSVMSRKSRQLWKWWKSNIMMHHIFYCVLLRRFTFHISVSPCVADIQVIRIHECTFYSSSE